MVLLNFMLVFLEIINRLTRGLDMFVYLHCVAVYEGLGFFLNILHLGPDVRQLTFVHSLLGLCKLIFFLCVHHLIDVGLQVEPQARPKDLVRNVMQLDAFLARKVLVLEVKAQLVNLHGTDVLGVTHKTHLVLQQLVETVVFEHLLQTLQQPGFNFLLALLEVIHAVGAHRAQLGVEEVGDLFVFSGGFH